jgi:hypothetical protein
MVTAEFTMRGAMRHGEYQNKGEGEHDGGHERGAPAVVVGDTDGSGDRATR